ncbi:MAG TPA: YihY/virulence factor BrkB family protein [Solirubrobacteraceae bacterium]|nr:YihY/virulence factor BrkB family protein [Solirubrobacteraceae bacterium]
MKRRRVRNFLARIVVATRRAVEEFIDDRGHRSAAQIAFFAVLSFIPLVLLVAGGFGLFFEDAAVRERIIRTVFDNVPLASSADRPRLERAVDDALRRAGNLGILTTILLVVAASGVMGALRHSINEAWDIDERPPLLKRKALDFALILGGTSILALSVSVTFTHRLADVVDDEAGGGPLLAAGLDAAGELLPVVFTALGLLFVYRVLPMHREPLRHIWPGAVVATIGLTIVKLALELYFEQLADFGAIYGSLGAAMALLIFVYAAANVVVFGAEFSAEWSRLPRRAT